MARGGGGDSYLNATYLFLSPLLKLRMAASGQAVLDDDVREAFLSQLHLAIGNNLWCSTSRAIADLIRYKVQVPEYTVSLLESYLFTPSKIGLDLTSRLNVEFFDRAVWFLAEDPPIVPAVRTALADSFEFGDPERSLILLDDIVWVPKFWRTAVKRVTMADIYSAGFDELFGLRGDKLLASHRRLRGDLRASAAARAQHP